MAVDSHTDEELEQTSVLRTVLGDALPKMQMFYTKLAKEGEQRGIIGPRDVDIIWERHILNSAAVVPYIHDAVEGERYKTVADIGSGGGFPGIVAAACLPECEFTLVEPMERRVEWLNECVSDMDLQNVTVLRSRSEDLMKEMRRDKGMHPFSVVTCRAVAPMRKLAGWTLPLLKHQGMLIALKGRSAPQEVEKASKEIHRFNGQHAQVVEAQVGPELEPTHLVLLEKR